LGRLLLYTSTMALTPQDAAFYNEKLGWRGFIYLLIATVLFGAFIWPVLLYVQDYSAGKTGDWSFVVVRNLALNGMMLGCIVSILMFFLARFYLWMGWLPRRR
jgi:hypothetical protein